MKLEIPFYKQTTHFNCGPTALRMALAYLEKDPGLEILEEKSGIKKGKAVSTLEIATAAALLGYNTELFSIHLYFNEENLKLEFYQKYTELAQQSKELVRKAEDAGVKLKETKLSLNEVLKKLTKDSVPIVLLDWNVVTGRKDKGYQGHFVPIVGYDDQTVYVHNPGSDTGLANFPIIRNLFDEARKAAGTDEDLMIIHRKK